MYDIREQLIAFEFIGEVFRCNIIVNWIIISIECRDDMPHSNKHSIHMIDFLSFDFKLIHGMLLVDFIILSLSLGKC